MSALSHFLTSGTAPWWGAPAGVIVGAVAGQLVAAQTSRQSDKRKFREERARFQAEKANASRTERLEHARTVGVKLIREADELACALISVHKQMSTLYAGLVSDSMTKKNFKSISQKTEAAALLTDSSTKRLKSLRAELEIVAPGKVVEAAIALIAAANGLMESDDNGNDETGEEELNDDSDAGYLAPDWIIEPRQRYDSSRSAMIDTLKRFVDQHPSSGTSS